MQTAESTCATAGLAIWSRGERCGVSLILFAKLLLLMIASIGKVVYKSLVKLVESLIRSYVEGKGLGSLPFDLMGKMGSKHDLLYVLYGKTGVAIIDKIKAMIMSRMQQAILRDNHNRRFLIEEFLGVNMQFDLYSFTDLIVLNEIRLRGLFERSTSKFIVDALKLGDTFVDVGANSGYYSLLASKRVGDSGKVYSFEPFPPAFMRLKRNIEMNNSRNIFAIPKAISREEGKQSLFVSDLQDGMSSLIPVSHKNVLTVEVTTLDAFVPRENIALVKIDVEGAESDVLLGAQHLLSSGRLSQIVVEWNRPLYSAWQCDSYFNNCKEIGEVYRILDGEEPKGYALHGPIKDRRILPVHCNLLIVPR